MQINGTKYQTPCVLVVGKSMEDDELQFGHVLAVLVDCEEVLFEFELMKAEYCNHFHAYALSLPPASHRHKYLIKQKDLASFHPYGMYHCPNITNNPSSFYEVTFTFNCHFAKIIIIIYYDKDADIYNKQCMHVYTYIPEWLKYTS